MNDSLFCSICVDTDARRDVTAALIADLVAGRAINGAVDCAWARILVDDDYGDFEVRQQDPTDFLGWATLIEVMPYDHVQRDEALAGVKALMEGLIARGLSVLAKADYADVLPGRGEVAAGQLSAQLPPP